MVVSSVEKEEELDWNCAPRNNALCHYLMWLELKPHQEKQSSLMNLDCYGIDKTVLEESLLLLHLRKHNLGISLFFLIVIIIIICFWLECFISFIYFLFLFFISFFYYNISLSFLIIRWMVEDVWTQCSKIAKVGHSNS